MLSTRLLISADFTRVSSMVLRLRSCFVSPFAETPTPLVPLPSLVRFPSAFFAPAATALIPPASPDKPLPIPVKVIFASLPGSFTASAPIFFMISPNFCKPVAFCGSVAAFAASSSMAADMR